MVKFMVQDIDFNLKVEEFFETYFLFEDAVKLCEWVEDQDYVDMMTEDGFNELLDCIEDLEDRIAVLMGDIKDYFDNKE